MVNLNAFSPPPLSKTKQGVPPRAKHERRYGGKLWHQTQQGLLKYVMSIIKPSFAGLFLEMAYLANPICIWYGKSRFRSTLQ